MSLTASEHVTLSTWRWATFLENLSLRHRRYVWLGIITFYLLSMNGLWRPSPDSALYLSLARNIARGEGYTYMGEAHRLVYPGLPYFIAGVMKLTPDHAIAITSAVMVECTLLSLYLCERLFRMIVRPGTALVATAMAACSYQIYSTAFGILTDIPFLLGSMMVLLGGALCGIMPAPRLDEQSEIPTARQRASGWVLLPLGLALCAIMRPTFYLLAICVVLAALCTIVRRRNLRHILIVGGVVALVAAVYLLVSETDPRRAHSVRDIYEQAVAIQVSMAQQDPRLLLANAWRIVTPELPTAFLGFYIIKGDPILVLVLLSATVWILWRWPAAILWIALTLGIQFIVEPVPRYMIPILPLLILAWWTAAVRISERIRVAPAANVITMAAYALLIPGLCRCVGQVWYEQYRRPFAQYYRGGSFAVIDEAASLIRARTPRDALILVPEETSSVLTYLSDRPCVDLGKKIPEPVRRRPRYVLSARNDAAAQQYIGSTFAQRRKVGRTRSAYRKNGVLVLTPAQARESE